MNHEPECECCAQGGPSPEFFEKLHVQIREAISSHGQFLQGVVGDEGTNEAFIYTIGNHERGLPELLAIGFYQDAVANMLNAMGRYMRKQERPFLNGEIVDVGSPVKFKIIEASREAHENYTFGVERFYETEDYRVQQVILPDPQGRFPGDPGCEKPYDDLPVLSLN